jgi:hypothetical protein
MPPTPPPTAPSAAAAQVTYGLQANCKHVNSNRYDICLDLVGVEGKVKSWMDAFADAREAWEQVIIGHLGTFSGSSFKNILTPKGLIGTDVPATVDDMYIFGAEVIIDGPFGILGSGKIYRVVVSHPFNVSLVLTLIALNSAGPTLVTSGSRMPVAGRMRFDKEDIEWLQSQGGWIDVIKHEMVRDDRGDILFWLQRSMSPVLINPCVSLCLLLPVH